VLLKSAVSWTVVFLPVALLPVVLLSLGLSWFLASLGTFLRDIGPIVGVLNRVLTFMTPIFYPVTALPAPFRLVIGLNPLAFVVEEVRGILFYARTHDGPALAAYLAGGVAWLGLAWFQRTRSAFANVL
jgi:lipopolysaccharide transport system permease protein